MEGSPLGSAAPVLRGLVLQVVGRLADKPATDGTAVRGLLVRKAFADSIMHPEDLPTFTKLHPGRVLQRQALASSAPFDKVGTGHRGVPGVRGAGCSMRGWSCQVRGWTRVETSAGGCVAACRRS
jgi:Pre-mRNA 3'-end-processing endonuclease polyadenylation factor C-term